MEIFMDSLTKKYGKVIALNNINIDINSHGCVGLLGPNGAGKTTMLKLATNIIKPTSGKVEINNINVSQYPEKAMKYVGSLIEQPEFYPYLSGTEILEFTQKIRGISKNDYSKEIKSLKDETNITEFVNRKTGAYSRGMKQRLALAVAMLGDPEKIILDEPTFGLDPKGMYDIRELIKRISKEHLVLLSTHLIYEARELCDRTIIINKGSICHDSKMEENKDLLKITADNKIKIISNKIINYTVDSNYIIIEKNKNFDNYEVINDLLNEGLRINYVEKYDNLENVYVSIINKEDSYK